jgi:hypothetical protein
MRILVVAAIAFASLSCVAPDDAQRAALVGAEIEILTHCPDAIPACVRMTLSDTSRDEPPPSDSTGYASVRLPVRGRLGDAAAIDTALVLRSFTDGIACSSLGQATVAVVGFSDAGEPIVLTSQGPFTLVASTLRVGCEDCALLLAAASTDTIATLRTPAWDFTEVGRQLADLSYDDTGSLFMRSDTACVALHRNARFAVVSADACAPMSEIGNFARQPARMRLEPAEWLFGAPARKHLLFVKSGACT